MSTRAARAAWGLRDAVRSRLWPIPSFAVGLALVLGVVVPGLDRGFDDSLPRWLDVLAFSGDPDAARTVLDAVASSLITVTSLTFSLTVVTLQLASGQFSPRLLRTFTQDLFVQVTLGLFLGTFVYALTVLRSVHSAGSGGRTEFVPRAAVTLGFLLAVAGVLALVGFLAHLSRQIRVETMLLTVRKDAISTVRVLLDDLPVREVPEPLPAPPAGAATATLLAAGSGFHVRLDTRDLTDSAARLGLTVAVDSLPGSFVVEGTPVGRAWRAEGTPVPLEDRDSLQHALDSALTIGPERTSSQDIGYGLRQLADVADKALSPGINDPTTAVHALGHVSTVLCAVASRRLGPVSFGDADGNLWLGVARADLHGLLELGLSQPRHYGAGDPQVAARLVTVLGDVAWHVVPAGRDVVRRHLDLLRTSIAGADHLAADREQLDSLLDGVEQRLSVLGSRAAATA